MAYRFAVLSLHYSSLLIFGEAWRFALSREISCGVSIYAN